MQRRITHLLSLVSVLLSCVLAHVAFEQIRPAIPTQQPASVHSQDDSLSVFLNLCVQGTGTANPCPPEIDSTPYAPIITYTYGQILDGVVGSKPYENTGTFTIAANGVTFCTIPAGTSTPCPASSTLFDPGEYTLYAMYNPPDGGAPVQSPPVEVTVLKDSVTSFTLTSSMNPAAVGTPVTFTATAVGSFGEPATGTITFTDASAGANPLGASALNGSGAATLTTASLAIGTHTIHASYPGSIDFNAPADAVLSQVILPPGTATALSSSVNPSALGQNVTFTATVATVAMGAHPTGAVSFEDGTKPFATVLVSPQGVASSSISTLDSGTHNITADYSGDAITARSVSPILVQQVDYPLTQAAPGFIVTVTPSPVVLGVGLAASLTVTVTPRNGFSGPVTLTCGDLPRESTCTFAQSVIPSGGGATFLELALTSPHDCGSNTPYFLGVNSDANRPGGFIHNGLRYGAPVLAGVLLIFLPKRRRLHKGLLGLCACLSLALLSGCGSACTDFGTYPGSYTFKVIGTAPAALSATSTGGGTPLTVQTSVGLTVKI